eukprot:TRINITY_DN6099_c0_g2_i1.p1 TRINITY_DN6099_c0_g2~~TRINITY_DN6099_c0_g2_i1.p1  ORF type:complete len:654 (+),score=220.92 TRINITY_DN6099_c0_g2_i1:1662-3623(+)
MFEELGGHYPRYRGWGRARDALADFYSFTDATKVQHVDQLIQDWFQGNAPQCDPTTAAEGGHFAALYDKVDSLYSAQYMRARLKMQATITAADPGRQHELMAGLHGVLMEHRGRELEAAAALEAEYREGAEATAAFVRAYCQRHSPGQSAEAETLLAQHQSRDAQLALKYALLQRHQPERHRELVAWSPSHPPGSSILPAVREFFAHRCQERVGLAEAICATYGGREASLVEQMLDLYEGPSGYSQVWRQRAGQGKPQFFPPWYNDDYPSGHVPAGCLPPPAAGALTVPVARPLPPWEPGGEEGSVRSRLLQVLQRHAPEQCADVDALLQQHRGREEELLREVAAAHGTVPPSAETAPSAPLPRGQGRIPLNFPPSPTTLSLRVRVRRLIARRAPGQAEGVGELLAQHAGEERGLLDSLVAEHGPEPPPDAKQVARLRRFYAKHAPEKAEGAEQMLLEWAGREDELETALEAKYGAEDGDGTLDDVRGAVRSCYARHAPDKLPAVDSIVDSWPRGGAELLDALAAKYAADSPDAIRARVVRMYQHYQPGREDACDRALRNFSGREGCLLDALVAKHGPEPPADAKPAAGVDPDTDAAESEMGSAGDAEADAPDPAPVPEAVPESVPERMRYSVPPPSERMDFAALIAWCEDGL